MKRLKKITGIILSLVVFFISSGFDQDDFSLADLKGYCKEFKSEEMTLCSTSSTKTYEDYRAISNVESVQYKFIHEHLTVDEETGFLYDKDGFIAVAMGYAFGEIGSRYYINLDTGITIPVVKTDAKAAEHAPNGCSAGSDASVIEFVIDSARAYEYFGSANGLASNGNFNNYEYLRGNIASIERVLDERIEEGVVYVDSFNDPEKQLDYGDNFRIIIGSFRQLVKKK